MRCPLWTVVNLPGRGYPPNWDKRIYGRRVMKEVIFLLNTFIRKNSDKSSGHEEANTTDCSKTVLIIY